ncbi:hypothetical protein BT93_L2221 [Corymbia citriodora subsp. variegata]|uniref:F-box domain-containing protein n=1 Tax=Corymbia citriodora subsp. variegata TaxID=360336 RepID=A0A8T0CKI7_CORYI|nr:hypothetical protein BT93_L2221 [Corymbia citriodora subsp. variegata]
MDETAVARKSEYGKPNEVLDIDAVANSINDLPEAILEHILSFVPIEDAVRTCVLSKNWRYLWTSYPNLELVEWAFSGREQFTNFVDRVLVLQSSSRIKRLVLSCRDLGDASRVNLWVSTAVKRNVEDFTVHLSIIPGNFILPHCLFSSATLTRLNLCILGALKLPCRIWFPNLKVLHLEYITFVDKRSTEQLLSSPVLEELTLRYCTWDNLETLTIRTPMLKILTIHDEDFDCPYDFHLHSCQVSICGNNLKSIHCISPFFNDYQVKKSCSLLEVRINVPHWRLSRTRQVAYRLHKLLKVICSVQKLMLSSTAVKLVLSSVDELCSCLPVFPNLNVDKDVAILDPAPHCFGSHLRQIKLYDLFLPSAKEVLVLESLLKHAMVLEKFMKYYKWLPSERTTQEIIQEMLLQIRCGSKSLEIAVRPSRV